MSDLEDAFVSIFGNSSSSCFLVASNGDITFRNAVAVGDFGEIDQIDAIFTGYSDDSAAVAYRLSKSALIDGHVQTQVTFEHAQFEISLHKISDDFLAWNVRKEVTSRPEESTTQTDANGDDDTASNDIPFDELPIAFVRLDATGIILFANSGARRLLNDPDIIGRNICDLLEGLAKPIPDRLVETLAGRAQGKSEVSKGKNADGYLQVTMSRVDDSEGGAIVAVLSDATELKTLEAQFVQSQKMQAVGQLAGGIAHDFNNLLTAINGHCDLLLLKHVQGDSDHSDLMQIRQNANRAASLVRQLLAFSRKQNLQPQRLKLFDTLAELANLLNRLLGEKVELNINNKEDIWPVRVDERQLEQVVVNLVVNARDAMPEGGTVMLRTRNVELLEPMERDRAIVSPGRYSVIEVEDTGTGISRDKLSKIFEPFFTTKRVGDGTGLGLSTAYGIIKQMDGYIFVDSEEGRGALFSIYLPAFDGPEEASEAEADKPPLHQDFQNTTGKGVILLVEDEAPVRAFAKRALELRGYTVLEADTGEAALKIAEDPAQPIDLFVSDVIMPGIDGPSWVQKAYETRPETSTVFVSGYSEDAFENGRPAIARSSYLAKPFTLNDLTARVREHLDQYPVRD